MKTVSFIQFGVVIHTWPSEPLRSPSPEDTDAPPNSRRGRANSASRHPGMKADVRKHHGNAGNIIRSTIRIRRWKFVNGTADNITIRSEILWKNFRHHQCTALKCWYQYRRHHYDTAL